MTTSVIENYLHTLKLPETHSHKGQNGKVLIIGGSNLFHAASKWSLDVASKFVDMVFYTSVPSNNALVEQAKGQFWNGIVVERKDLESYLEEADAILIGPGMERSDYKKMDYDTPPTEEEWTTNTQKITNYLLKKYPHKKWVIDAGALQMVDPSLLTKTMILTPHKQELERLEGLVEEHLKKTQMQETGHPTADSANSTSQSPAKSSFEFLISKGVAIVLKGPTDFIYHNQELIEVTGGNPGMTKGGTGDVLAGLIAALYATNEMMTAAVVGSYANKQAGEVLAQSVGPFFSASDLVDAIPQTLWRELQK